MRRRGEVYPRTVTLEVRLPTKLFFWLILGTLPVFFAEGAGGSALVVAAAVAIIRQP